MLDHQDLYELDGATVYDRDGDRLGTVATVFVDTQTDDATFAAVRTGLFGSRSSFVPLTDAELRDGDLHVAFSSDRVKDAPSVDADDRLDPGQELELYRYYGIPATTAGADTDPDRARPAATDGPSDPDLTRDPDLDADLPTGADLIADQGIDPVFDGPQVDPEASLRLRRLGDPVPHADEPRVDRDPDAPTDRPDEQDLA